MEFKVAEVRSSNLTPPPVDIGTEWNLKSITAQFSHCFLIVDIGTEWNLKNARQDLDSYRDAG